MRHSLDTYVPFFNTPTGRSARRWSEGQQAVAVKLSILGDKLILVGVGDFRATPHWEARHAGFPIICREPQQGLRLRVVDQVATVSLKFIFSLKFIRHRRCDALRPPSPACGWRRRADEPAGLVRRDDTGRLGPDRLLEAADRGAGVRPEEAVHRPWVIPQPLQRRLDLPAISRRHGGFPWHRGWRRGGRSRCRRGCRRSRWYRRRRSVRGRWPG